MEFKEHVILNESDWEGNVYSNIWRWQSCWKSIPGQRAARAERPVWLELVSKGTIRRWGSEVRIYSGLMTTVGLWFLLWQGRPRGSSEQRDDKIWLSFNRITLVLLRAETVGVIFNSFMLEQNLELEFRSWVCCCTTVGVRDPNVKEIFKISCYLREPRFRLWKKEKGWFRLFY